MKKIVLAVGVLLALAWDGKLLGFCFGTNSFVEESHDYQEVNLVSDQN